MSRTLADGWMDVLEVYLDVGQMCAGSRLRASSGRY